MGLLPKISIITPSYNQGKYIEQTILSVISQNYPNLEYIIVDGGSTDDTVSIIKKYQDKIAYWVSEPDAGQANAINKGLQKVNGDIIAFINSDDYYEPGVFDKIAASYLGGDQWIIGAVRNFRDPGTESYIVKQICNNSLFDWLVRNNENHQPGNFWSKKILQQVGRMNETLHYCFDWEYWIRFIENGFVPQVYNDDIFTNFRLHEESKTVKSWRNFNREFIQLMEDHKQFLDKTEVAKVDREVIELRLEEKIKFAGIESINARFKASFALFKEAFQLYPKVIFRPAFVAALLKASIYMPLKKMVKNIVPNKLTNINSGIK